jgi:aminoglycoside/choline kinase family phosphotransferase
LSKATAATVPLERLERLAQKLTGRAPTAILPMPGGASTRCFYRVTLATGKTAIGMYVPDATRPDEIVKTDEAGRRWPFLEVRDLLATRGVRVPGLLGEACEDGFVLVEDLGDDTLAQHLAREPLNREPLYRAAVRDLARAQHALANLPQSSIVSQRAFDEDLLKWEIEHFREWALEARGLALHAAENSTFDRSAAYLARTIAAWPRGFVHRDYQSRNLMVRPDSNGGFELVWIDFQDALLGPRVYDLVALLNDSYQTFERDFIEARLDDYAEELAFDAKARTQLGQEFDFVTVQRKLKDAGRFVFIDRVKGNPAFLQFVEPTIRKARGALQRLEADPEMARLARVLDRVFDQLS